MSLCTPIRNRTRSNFRASKGGAIRHFNDESFHVFPIAAFRDNGAEAVVKKALVMVEGDHVDSQGRPHKFSAGRIRKIVENTNRLLQMGGRVPWQRDHKKEQSANIGDLEGLLEIKRITESDLHDPRLSHLVGRLGAFTKNLVAKGADVVEELVAGRIKTLSPGIDIATDTIREISATPTPAIVGLSVFKRGEGNENTARFFRTWEELDAAAIDMEEIRGEYDELCDDFWTLITSINNLSDEELQGDDPIQLQYDAADGFVVKLQDLLGLGDTGELDPTQMPADGAMPNGQPRPTDYRNQLLQQDGQGAANMGLSMAEVAFEMYGGDRAEFAKRGRGKKKTARQRVLGTTAAGRIARLAALGAGTAAAVRYGGRGLKVGGRVGGLKGVAAGARAAGRQVRRDINAAVGGVLGAGAGAVGGGRAGARAGGRNVARALRQSAGRALAR